MTSQQHHQPVQLTVRPTLCLTHQPTRPVVILATAQVQLITQFSAHPIRLLIDPGSELTFISTRLVKTHHIQHRRTTIPIIGIGGSTSTHTKGIATVQLKSMHSSSAINVSAHILNTLTSSLPSSEIDSHSWPELSQLDLADPNFLKQGPIDMIIGADTYGQIIKQSIKRHPRSQLIAQLTIFGWIVLGPIYDVSSTAHNSFHTTVDPTNQQLMDLLTKFWVQQEVPLSTDEQLTPEEQECEDHFKSTHSRTQEGRYVVRIPLNSSATMLGDSQLRAQQCLKRLLIRIKKEDSYGSLYNSFLKEYETLGHMKLVTDNSFSTQRNSVGGGLASEMTLAHDVSASGGLRVSSGQSSSHICSTHLPYYLPHHGVLREHSETTKLRVVFNGSSPTTSGVSVNDIQHTGAKLQRDITDILIWIRKHKFLFTSDITKMYRQINIHPDDWDLQRIMWIDEQLNMVPYQLTTVTYGTRSAPFLAIRTMLQLIEDEGHKFPLAIEPLMKGRYVDDIFGGSDNIMQLKEIAHEVTQLLMAGGFPLAKWHSNSAQFIKHVSPNTTESSEHSFEDSSTKLLGLSWNPRTDTFNFSTKSSHLSSRLTKRIILSETAQLYDPLGFLSPFIIRAKVILQELWLDKLNWDEQVPTHIETKWNLIREELTHVSDISIPRWLQLTDSSKVELHGFSDASQTAMAAAVYLRVTDSENHVNVMLICSKSKVAPLKRLSIPRLELSAALILAKLMKYVQLILELTNVPITLWTDSSVTLTWIQSHSSRWKEFVRNRVSQIQDLTPSSVWRHIPGKDNPSDCASRGITISQLQKHSLWWTGPQWLIKDNSFWPNDTIQCDSLAHQEERPGLLLAVATTHPDYHWEMIYRYSSLIKLLRITAICFRVNQLIKKVPHSTLYYPLTPHDLETAKVYWIRATQAAFFSTELKLVRTSQLPPAHPFNRLTAFIDTEGILRVGGRLANSQLEREAIHPAILPRNSHLTQLIIDDAHKKTLHGGPQLTLNHIRQTYWIMGGKHPVKSFIHCCIKCARQRGERAQQLMGQLPSTRVTPSRSFSTSGVDYAGPLTIKSWKGRGAKKFKGWLCVFVCFTTSAVHLEMVSDYSSDSFVAAFRRFTGRRGICTTLYSDCATTFMGADATLRQLFTQGTQEFTQMTYSLANHGTTWRFNPPAAPHMGGKWEAAVKSVKHHLTRTIGETVLTYEELTTLLIQIEAVLNSRPLEPLTEDPDDISALTPAHFLIGEPIITIPEPSLMDTTQNRLTRWQLIQQRLQYFWSKWSTQYLQRQLSISKWHHPSHQIKVGSLVLITDERTPPTQWPLARVLELHPGKDGLTRVVTLKTATTLLKRPIAKLAILPIPSHEDQLNGSAK